MTYIALACRVALGLVFATSAATKLRNADAYRAFRVSLRQLDAVPAGLVAPVAALVATAEVAIIALVAVLDTAVAGFVLAAGVLVAFTGAILRSLRRGIEAPCRCFGGSRRPVGLAHVARNGLLLLIAGTGAATSIGSGGGIELAGAAVAVAAGLTVGLVAVVFDDFVDLFTAPKDPATRP